MRVIAQFNPGLATSGTFKTYFPNGVGRLVIMNQSPINLSLDFQNGETAYIAARDRRLFSIVTPSSQIKWSQQSSLLVDAAPIFQVTVEAYDYLEEIPESYPSPYLEQINIGNQLSHVLSASFVSQAGNQSGSNGLTVTLPSQAGTTTYLTRMKFTSRVASVGVVEYRVTLGNLEEFVTWFFWTAATTTTCGIIDETLPVPQPAFQPVTEIIATVTPLGSGTGQDYSLILYGYYT